MWDLSLAFRSWNCALRLITTRRKSMNSMSASRRVITLGVPSTSASMLAENVLCIAVSL